MKNIKFKKALKWIIIHFPEVISAAALFVAIIVSGGSALTRYIFKWTMQGFEEIACFCFAWTVFPAAAAAYRRKMHFGIDLIVNLFSAKIRLIIELLTHIMITVSMALLTYLSTVLAIEANRKTLSLIGLSYSWFDAAMVVGFGLMTVYSAIFLVQHINNMPKRFCDREEKAT